MNLHDLILPPGDTIDRIDLDKAAALIEEARACGAEAFDKAESCIRYGELLPYYEGQQNVVRAFQLASEAIKICEHSRDFRIMMLVICLRYEPFDCSYLDLIYQEIVDFISERDCGDEQAFTARCLLSSVVRMEIALTTMNLGRTARRKLHMLLAEARYTAEDARMLPDKGDRRERLGECYSSLKYFWKKINGSESVWD